MWSFLNHFNRSRSRCNKKFRTKIKFLKPFNAQSWKMARHTFKILRCSHCMYPYRCNVHICISIFQHYVWKGEYNYRKILFTWFKFQEGNFNLWVSQDIWEVRNSRVTKSSYRSESRKMTSHFKLLARNFF